MTAARPPSEALRAAVAAVGSQVAMARLLGISQPSVWRWLRHSKSLPAEFVATVASATGISKHELRPDLFADERTPADAALDRGDQTSQFEHAR